MSLEYSETEWTAGDLITEIKADNWETQYLSWRFDTPSELTIASAAITPTINHHTVDTESAASADTLSTITATNATTGSLLMLTPENVARVVTIDEAGNIVLPQGQLVMDSANSWILLRYDGANWQEVQRKATAGAIASYTSTLVDVSNTSSETEALKFTVPANDWGDGNLIRIMFTTLEKNNKGSAGTVTIKINCGAGGQVLLTNAINNNNNSNEYPKYYDCMMQRTGSDVTVVGANRENSYPYGWTGNMSASLQHSGGGAHVSTPTNFTSDFDVSIKTTLSAGSSLFYWNIQGASVLRIRGNT
jgi:hypothetical protein